MKTQLIAIAIFLACLFGLIGLLVLGASMEGLTDAEIEASGKADAAALRAWVGAHQFYAFLIALLLVSPVIALLDRRRR